MIDWPIHRMPRTAPRAVYIRLGRWGHKSRNHATGQMELGVSVYPARILEENIVELDDRCFEIPVDLVRGRVAFVVTGEEVGTGSDGEPVLRKVKAINYAIDCKLGGLLRIR